MIRYGIAAACATLTVGTALIVGADAPAGRYTISNGTVRDVKTTLTWQQVAPSDRYTWADAKTYCANLSLDGAPKWRLPTAKELLTIVDVTRVPAIDPTAFPQTPLAVFWSSTPSPQGSDQALGLDFTVGNLGNEVLATTLAVRCVR